MKLLYVEIKNSTGDITCSNPYIYSGKYEGYSNGFNTISDKTYTGFIVDVDDYIKKHQHKKANKMSPNVHNFIITRSRKQKISQIKNRMNG